MATTTRSVVLERASHEFVDETACGVNVSTARYDCITHDFMVLNPLRNIGATRGAVAKAISMLRALHSA